jgi:hypothetical protein
MCTNVFVCVSKDVSMECARARARASFAFVCVSRVFIGWVTARVVAWHDEVLSLEFPIEGFEE